MMISAKEISELLSISIASAYRIIRQLNLKLEKMGYMVVSGKTPRKFFYENFYLN